ncbi:MAG: hypothetical protein HOM11_06655 [Methylococcales bacterium]|jgi:D-glycerate 3-kinase|nr:hypothetical protein [Methylococcales bacterium]MBT7445119.1 hypothetical protein [Methylococcales bacterium]
MKPAVEVLKKSYIEFLLQEKITPNERSDDLLGQYYEPLAQWLASQATKRPVVVGLNGAQGSGKSTLALLLKRLLESHFNRRVLVLSLDDFYLSQQERRQLAAKVHPLLSTRGVPGTHDVGLAIRVVTSMIQNPSEPVLLPVFDKSIDDKSADRMSEPNPDIIVFEGWCVGSAPQTASQLINPINSLEVTCDTKGVWRHYVNEQLAGPYQTLFHLMDSLIMLKIPHFNSVLKWRLEQEQKLQNALTLKGAVASDIMTEKQLEQFVQYFERISRHTLSVLPEAADVLLSLGEDHQISQMNIKPL